MLSARVTDEEDESITSQIDELKQFFKSQQEIISDKSTNLESIIEQLDDVRERDEFDGRFEEIRNDLNGLLSTFQEKLASTSAAQSQAEGREDSLDETYGPITGMGKENGPEARQETIAQLQGYVHSNGHNLGVLGQCFSDVLDSANGLMSSIPMNKTNATHMDELVSLIEGCIGSFAL